MKLSEFKEKVIEEYGEEEWKEIENSYVYKIYTAPEEEQIEAVKQDGIYIQYIHNPSKELQLEAVKENGNALVYINNPSEEVQIEAVKENGNVIKYINNPSEKVQIEAVKQVGYTIRDINNPTDKVIKEAIKNIEIDYAYNLEYILRFLENDLKEEQIIKLSELKNMTLEQIKELLNKNMTEETNE